MKRNLTIVVLFVVGVGCFIVVVAAVIMGIMGIAQQLWRGNVLTALKILGSAVLMATVAFVLGGLAVQGLKRLRGDSVMIRGFDVLPPR